MRPTARWPSPAPLLRRGRPRDALAAIDEGARLRRRAGRGTGARSTSRRSAARRGSTSRGSTRPRACSAAALAARARAARDPVRIAAASLALARCLYLARPYAEADGGARRSRPIICRPAHACGTRLLAARIAVGPAATSTARCRWCSRRASRRRGDGDGRGQRRRRLTAAFVHLAVGDLDAVERDVVRVASAAARAAHDPLRAIRARLLQREADRGAADAARLRPRSLQRLRRVMTTAPPVAARAVGAVLGAARRRGDDAARDVVAQHVAATGLGALALVRGRIRRAPSRVARRRPIRSSTSSSRSCASARPRRTRRSC